MFRDTACTNYDGHLCNLTRKIGSNPTSINRRQVKKVKELNDFNGRVSSKDFSLMFSNPKSDGE